MVLVCALAGCQGSPSSPDEPGAASTSAASPRTPSAAPATPEPPGADTAEPDTATADEPTATDTTPTPQAAPARFRQVRAMAHVRWLAGDIGPREATSPAYARAAEGVARHLRRLGYDVRRQPLRVPSGVSWGVPVDAGRTVNVVAQPAGFRPADPHLLVGAHLDTVPQAPGAEDNASGVAVMLELARLAARDGTRLPVVFVAFGAEEPRGDGDALHHFGSKAYVDRMSPAQRRGLRAMVSLDRVGVGSVVPVCTGGRSPPRVRAMLVTAAEREGIPVQTCADNTSSDHWSFEKAGEPVARLGSTPFAGYHSAADVPSVVDPAQLGRVGRLAWSWLSR